MLSLKEICIKNICEQISRLSLFVYYSPLPWCLTQEISSKFAMYKWKALIRDAPRHEVDDIDYVFEFYEFEFLTDIPSRLRPSLLLTDNFEEIAHLDYYCAWTTYYKLEKFNLLLCKTCFKIFTKIFKSKNIKFNYSTNYFHENVLASELHNLYQSKSYWCQNSFNEILFTLKDRYDCDRQLHSSGRKRVRFCD